MWHSWIWCQTHYRLRNAAWENLRENSFWSCNSYMSKRCLFVRQCFPCYVFEIHFKSKLGRCWSDCAYLQADLGLYWSHMSEGRLLFWAVQLCNEPHCENNVSSDMSAKKQRLKLACAYEQTDQSSLSTWRNPASFAIQNAPSEDSDQTARMLGSDNWRNFSDVAVHTVARFHIAVQLVWYIPTGIMNTIFIEGV